MLKDFYNAIVNRLGQIVTRPADPAATPLPVFKQIGWWNEQWATEKEITPLRFPCVFVEFVSLPYEQLGNKVQQATAVIKLHIGSRSMDDESVNHLDLLEVVNYAITGFQGTNFGTFTRTLLEVDHNHDTLVAHAITYRARIQDNTAVRPLVVIEGDLFVLEYTDLPAEPQG